MKKYPVVFFLILSILVFNCAKDTAKNCFKKGFRYQLAENYDSAIIEYQKAIKLDSTYVQAYLNLGVVYTKKSMYDQAIDAYKKTIGYFPFHTKAYYNLGYVYCLKGDKQKALEQYNQLKSLDPQLAARLKEVIDK